MKRTIRLGVLTLVALSALALVSTAVAHRVVVIKGTHNGETLTGTAGNDRIFARGGDDLVNAGATWVDEPAFQDGNLIWGRIVDDIPDFCRELIHALIDQKARAIPTPAR